MHNIPIIFCGIGFMLLGISMVIAGLGGGFLSYRLSNYLNGMSLGFFLSGTIVRFLQ